MTETKSNAKNDLLSPNLSAPKASQVSTTNTKAVTRKKTLSLIVALILLIASIMLFLLQFKFISTLIFILAIFLFITLKLINKSKTLAPLNGTQLSNIAELRKRLFNLQYEDKVSAQGELLLKQYESLEKKYANFISILNSKFDPNELTYDRYLQPVQALYDGILSTFNKLENSFRILSKMNLEGESKILFDKTLAENLSMMDFQEKALQDLEKLSFALNQITTTNDSTPSEIKDSMEQLKILAERAKNYSTKNSY
ncbi:MAG: hypothetical protein L6Q37_04480 [Bdellovibrionaceae bacterium]|nr:hypothetical protein [Pseudobdellovibrionaceae bacterium]NUM57487.1 hypothetical protein [Pseudobdellovibrionaceae bacterium]